jgi:hypothetical protein
MARIAVLNSRRRSRPFRVINAPRTGCVVSERRALRTIGNTSLRKSHALPARLIFATKGPRCIDPSFVHLSHARDDFAACQTLSHVDARHTGEGRPGDVGPGGMDSN